MAFLVTGNIMDNAKGSEKPVIVSLEFALAFSFLIMSVASKLTKINSEIETQSTAADSVLHLISNLCYIFGGAVLMICSV